MPKEPEVTRVTEGRDAYGNPTYVVEGGHPDHGGTAYHIDKAAVAQYEKEHGRRETEAMLKRQIEASLEGRGQPSAR